jgi:hypothetical protein
MGPVIQAQILVALDVSSPLPKACCGDETSMRRPHPWNAWNTGSAGFVVDINTHQPAVGFEASDFLNVFLVGEPPSDEGQGADILDEAMGPGLKRLALFQDPSDGGFVLRAQRRAQELPARPPQSRWPAAFDNPVLNRCRSCSPFSFHRNDCDAEPTGVQAVTA